MKAIGCDIRRVLAACAVQCKGKKGTELIEILEKYQNFHIPQVINHHCAKGDCRHCDARWCAHKRLILENDKNS